jgi:uncharacterized protein with GYD domain
MRTYILLSTVSPQGLQTLRSTPERLLEVNREVEAMGGRVLRQWALLGPYDFLSIVEAPSDATIARLTVELGSRGSARFETLPVVEIDDLLAALAGDPP